MATPDQGDAEYQEYLEYLDYLDSQEALTSLEPDDSISSPEAPSMQDLSISRTDAKSWAGLGKNVLGILADPLRSFYYNIPFSGASALDQAKFQDEIANTPIGDLGTDAAINLAGLGSSVAVPKILPGLFATRPAMGSFINNMADYLSGKTVETIAERTGVASERPEGLGDVAAIALGTLEPLNIARQNRVLKNEFLTKGPSELGAAGEAAALANLGSPRSSTMKEITAGGYASTAETRLASQGFYRGGKYDPVGNRYIEQPTRLPTQIELQANSKKEISRLSDLSDEYTAALDASAYRHNSVTSDPLSRLQGISFEEIHASPISVKNYDGVEIQTSLANLRASATHVKQYNKYPSAQAWADDVLTGLAAIDSAIEATPYVASEKWLLKGHAPYAEMLNFGLKENGELGVSQLDSMIEWIQRDLRKGGVYDISKAAKGAYDPSAFVELSEGTKQVLSQVQQSMRLRREELVDRIITTIGADQLALSPNGLKIPLGFSGSSLSRINSNLHDLRLLEPVLASSVGDISKGMGRRPGTLTGSPGLFGGRLGRVGATLDNLGANLYDRVVTPLGFSPKSQFIREQFGKVRENLEIADYIKLARERAAMGGPGYMQKSPNILTPMLESGLYSTLSNPEDFVSPHADAIKAKFPVMVDSHSIGRSVASIDEIPPDIRAQILLFIGGELDGPALMQQEMRLKQPAEKAMFWSEISRSFPQVPFASGITGLKSEFDDGGGAKLWRTEDRAFWAEAISRSPLREDAKAQLTSSLFRDGTVFPLQQAGELTQIPISNPTDNLKEELTKALIASRRSLVTNEKLDMING